MKFFIFTFLLFLAGCGTAGKDNKNPYLDQIAAEEKQAAQQQQSDVEKREKIAGKTAEKAEISPNVTYRCQGDQNVEIAFLGNDQMRLTHNKLTESVPELLYEEISVTLQKKGHLWGVRYANADGYEYLSQMGRVNIGLGDNRKYACDAIR